jgi:hypothetical protein
VAWVFGSALGTATQGAFSVPTLVGLLGLVLTMVIHLEALTSNVRKILVALRRLVVLIGRLPRGR